MALSVRQVASGCLGLSGGVSVTRNVFGYAFGLPAKPISLKAQLERAKGRAFNLSVILVNHAPGFTGTVTRAQVRKITFAIQRTRELYAQQSLGIRKVYWSWILPADVGGYTNIASQSEAECLTEDWSADNDGIDLFFVQDIDGAGGWSAPVVGSCDKNVKGVTGAVVELSDPDEEFTAIITAHEVGHYLGLAHATTSTNLMGVDSNNDGIGEINNGSVNLTTTQGTTMRAHCSVKGPC